MTQSGNITSNLTLIYIEGVKVARKLNILREIRRLLSVIL